MKVALALGSNLGDRRSHLDWAIAQLRRLLKNLRVSSVLETEPQSVPDEQPLYLNAVVVGETDLPPQELIDALMALERERGRERPASAPGASAGKPNAARTLDLDIILYGDRVVRTPTLEIPHARFRERDFVLGPLAELEPDWVDPVTGRTVRTLNLEL